MKKASITLRLLCTLLTILGSPTISGATVQDTQAGIVFEKTCAHEGEIGLSAEVVAPRTTGYNVTHPDVVPLIKENGFKPGTAPGRLGSGGTYVNDTRAGAIAEFQHHNPGVTPSVLKVEYNPGVNASTNVAPRNYVENLPLNNVDGISAPFVRLPGTTNTNA